MSISIEMADDIHRKHSDNIQTETAIYKDAVKKSGKSIIGSVNGLKVMINNNLQNSNYNIINCICK